MKLRLLRFFILNIFLLFSILCYGQEKIRTVENAISSDGLIELANSKIGEKAFDTESQVLANKDWLKTLNLGLRNTSKKTIVYVRLELQIERIGKMKYPLRLPFKFGQMPLITVARNSKIIPETVETLKPNEVTTISLQPQLYDFLVQFMRENEVEDVEEVKVFFEFILFEDGTAWSKGHEMRRNIKNPNQWDVIGVWQKEVSLLQNRPLPNAGQILVSGWKQNNFTSRLSASRSFFLQIVQRQHRSQKQI